MNQPAPVPIAIAAPQGAAWFEITWQGGQKQRLPNAIVRGYCPCASCQGHVGPISFVPGRDSELLELNPVGNYGLRLLWGDRHETGIYTFRFLKQLADLYAEHGDALPQLVPQLLGR